MNKKILYSAVGGTDPISNFRDGSLLHICRKYKPDKVVILVSAEMCNHHHNDNRYLYCIEKLGELLNHHFEVEVIEQPTLRKVNDIDTVYPIIKENISNITAEMDESDILYVNIASGTPAMKYTQQFLSAINKYKIVPVSVSTPAKKINPHIEDIDNYNVEEMWEINEDNDPDKYEDRCSETKSMIMLSDFYKITLKEFVSNYNYSAALTLIESMPHLCTDNLKEVLEGANARLQRNLSKAVVALSKHNFVFPYNDDKRIIFEYALSLGIKLKKNEIADFVRAVTPLVGDLYIRTLQGRCNINLDDYTTNDNGHIKWSESKLAGTQLDDILQSKYTNGFKYGTVSNVHLREILSVLVQDEKALKYIKNIGKFEEDIRNKTAHTMVSMTSDKVKSQTGFTPEEIYTYIKKLMEFNYISVKEWNSYDKMNTLILNEIDNS